MAKKKDDRAKRGKISEGAATPPPRPSQRKPGTGKASAPSRVGARLAAKRPPAPPAPSKAVARAATRKAVKAPAKPAAAGRRPVAKPEPAAKNAPAAKPRATARPAAEPRSRAKARPAAGPQPATATKRASAAKSGGVPKPAAATKRATAGGPAAAAKRSRTTPAGGKTKSRATATTAAGGASATGASRAARAAASGTRAVKRPAGKRAARQGAGIAAAAASAEALAEPQAVLAAGTPEISPALAGAQSSDSGTVISEWPPKVDAPAPAKGKRRVAKARTSFPGARQRRSRRGVIVAGLVALLVGIVLGAFNLGLPLPGSKNPPTPSSGGWSMWVIIGAAMGAVFLVGAAIATSQKKGWRWVLDTRVVGLVAALVLVCVGVTQLFPPGAKFDPGELPNLAGNALQGIGAQPESGYPRIKISRVAIDLLLVKGDGKTPPVKYEAFTFPNADHLLAANSDGTGNSYVYAHARNGMFWRLHDLHIGDVIEVDYGNNKVYKYRVSEIHPGVNWRDLSWLQPTADDRLTLQTCNGWKDDDPRFIVVARRATDQTALNGQ